VHAYLSIFKSLWKNLFLILYPVPVRASVFFLLYTFPSLVGFKAGKLGVLYSQPIIMVSGWLTIRGQHRSTAEPASGRNWQHYSHGTARVVALQPS
jgi:hypothetical protein